MKWSAHLTYKKYLLARALSLPAVFYIYLFGLFALLGIYGSQGSVLYLVTYLVFVVTIMIGVFCFSVGLQLRRMRGHAGSDIMNYEITDGAIKLSAGERGVSLPLNDFTFKREGRYFLSFKRKKTMVGVLLLIFDDQETLQQAKVLLTK